MLSIIQRTRHSLSFPVGWQQPLRALLSTAETAKASRQKKPVEAEEPPKLILLTKQNLPQSPLKMKFLVSLVRRTWFDDAMAQMKFSPKHRAADMIKLLKRGSGIARAQYNAIPEELFVREVMVTKGSMRRGIRIMGKGRYGMSEERKTHVRLTLEVANIKGMVAEAKSQRQAVKLLERMEMIEQLKKEQAEIEEE